jgi:hypothetical protein
MAETLGRGSRQRPDPLVLSALHGAGVERAWCGWMPRFSTLLGPEGTSSACCFGRRSHLLTQTATVVVCVSGGGVGWLFVEMCIVDASIFVSLCR